MTTNKRVLAVLLLLFGLMAIGGILWWAFGDLLRQRFNKQSMVVVPTPVPSEILPVMPQAQSVPPRAPSPAVLQEEQERNVLRQRAMDLAARQGSYGSVDQFSAITLLANDVSPTVMRYLEQQRAALMVAHPRSQTWVQTTRALSNRIVSGTPLVGSSKAVVVVQAQQIVEDGARLAEVSYREITIGFEKNDGKWLATRIESRDLKL